MQGICKALWMCRVDAMCMAWLGVIDGMLPDFGAEPMSFLESVCERVFTNYQICCIIHVPAKAVY
jgi:hypothetical protein